MCNMHYKEKSTNKNDFKSAKFAEFTFSLVRAARVRTDSTGQKRVNCQFWCLRQRGTRHVPQNAGVLTFGRLVSENLLQCFLLPAAFSPLKNNVKWVSVSGTWCGRDSGDGCCCRAGRVVTWARRLSSDDESSEHPGVPSSLKNRLRTSPMVSVREAIQIFQNAVCRLQNVRVR